MVSLNKKSQFGPDALVGVVLLAVLGLGGIFFVSIFVNTMSLQGLLAILDSETNQKCYFYLLSVSGSEFIRSGEHDIEDLSPSFKMLKDKYGGESPYEEKSYYFEQKTKSINAILGRGSNLFINLPMTVQSLDGISGEAGAVANWRSLTIDKYISLGANYEQCALPSYSPSSKQGTVEIFFSEVNTLENAD